jgi:hypothetical protein
MLPRSQSFESVSEHNCSTHQKGDTLVQALEKYEDELTPFELREISKYNCIHTVGSVRIAGQGKIQGRDGFYIVTPGE